MPRRPRLILPRTPLHLIQRGNNRQPCFHSDSDYLVYLEWLREHADGTGCAVHSYALMSNHVHLLISFDDEAAPGALMKAQGERYVRYFNKRHGRSGTLWEGRYRSCVVDNESYLMKCHSYIEYNPVRAGMVVHPADYRWSSHPGNAGVREDALLTPHELYNRLGADDGARQAAYRELLLEPMREEELQAIRRATNGNFVLGDEGFADAVSRQLGRRASAGAPGRPKKNRGQTTFSEK